MINRYGNKNLFYGVCEDRMDPLFLGRCRVRIVGLHTPNKQELPTADLPWAFPLQPITSSAMNGIGQAPVGPVEGTWVILTFNDDEYQQPFMLGSIGGIPFREDVKPDEIQEFLFSSGTQPVTPHSEPEKGILVDSSGAPVTDSSGQTITTGSAEPKVLGSLTQSQVDKLKKDIAKKESGGDGDLKAVNTLGYLGRYQFGSMALQDLGYVKMGTSASSKVLIDASVWTSKQKITCKEDFLGGEKVQEECMDRYMRINYNRMKQKGQVDENTPPEKLAGLLWVAHNQGHGAVTKMLNGTITSDAYGTSTKSVYDLGYASVTGTKTLEFPTKENVPEPAIDKDGKTEENIRKKNLITRTRVSTQVGFNDPNKKYPKTDHLEEPDTDRLARNQKIDKTIVGKKDQERFRGIPTALGGAPWDQPEIPYNSKYPFNHVYVSESGHVMEFDDTEDNERINLHHMSGTFTEIDKNGTQVNRIVGQSFELLERDGIVYIKGNCHVTIDGSSTVLVKQNVFLEVQGNMDFKVAGNLTGKVGGNYNLTIGGNNNVTLGGTSNLRAVGTINEDGSQIHMNSGRSAAASTVKNNPESVVVLPSTSRSQEEEFMFETQGEAAEEYKKKQEDATVVPPPPVVNEEDKTPPPKVATIKTECDMELPVTPEIILSPNFKIKHLTPGTGGAKGIVAQHGLSVEKIACNLKKLAINCLEPAKQLYPNMKISSGFRWAGSGISKAKGISKHELGFAADIQIPGIKRAEYYDVAQKLKASIPYDKLLLEYRGNSTWIHIQFSDTPQQIIGTLVNDSSAAPGGMGKFVRIA